MTRHFTRISDISAEQAARLVRRAEQMKTGGHRSDLLAGKVAALIFEKPSTRTRVSFEVAVRHLGGDTLFMSPADSQLGRSEPLKDTARVLARYVDVMIVRTFEQEKLVELSEYADIPVVNALSDSFHPCQVMSDLLTVYERTPDFENLTIAYVGDGNNMANSWINAAAYFPFELRIASPKGFDPDPDVVRSAENAGARLVLTRDPVKAVTGADYVNTDVWASMGQEHEHDARLGVFRPYQVNAELMSHAAPGAKVMHCLPAHRAEEITDEVIEGPASVVWDQAENRLHMQKAILEMLFSPGD